MSLISALIETKYVPTIALAESTISSPVLLLMLMKVVGFVTSVKVKAQIGISETAVIVCEQGDPPMFTVILYADIYDTIPLLQACATSKLVSRVRAAATNAHICFIIISRVLIKFINKII